MMRIHQPGQAVFRSVLPEDIDWKPFPAFPPRARLAVVVGQPTWPAGTPRGCSTSTVPGLNHAQEKPDELRAIRLKWLEEPVWPPENYVGLARLRRTSGNPIAAGENVPALMDFDRLMGAEAVDFVQPSPAKMGGVTELVRVFPAATPPDTAKPPPVE